MVNSSEQFMLTLFLRRKILSKNLSIIQEAVQPIIESNSCELVDLEYVNERGQYYLRLYVDQKPNGIDIDKIAQLSELVGEKLDAMDPDPLPNPYILELSSPGLERPIKNAKDWEYAKGQYIHVGLYQKLEGDKTFEGTLQDVNNDEIKLEIKIKTRRKTLTIPRRQIANARFAIEF